MDMQNFILTFIVLMNAVIAICGETLPWIQCPEKYKKFSPDHSFCLRPCCSCPYYSKELSQSTKDYILFLHNSYRNKVAAGYSYGVNHLPRATNMLQMVWDDELANLAQKWANTCPLTSHDCDRCRVLDQFPVGQIIIEWDGKMDQKDLEMEFENYFNGLTYLKQEHISSYSSSNGKDRYTQLLWAKTWRIGCGFLYYSAPNEKSKSSLVCNYGPAGNVEGDEVYKAGDACSACPGNTCCGDSCKKHGITSNYADLCKIIDASKPPEGDVPHKKTGKEIFYCGFNGESDCSHVAEGYDAWYNIKDIGGARLAMNLGTGWTSTLHFTSPIKSNANDICIKIVTRKGTLKPNKVYNYEMTAKVEWENRYARYIGFPRVDEKTKFMYQVDYIQLHDFPKKKNLELSLTFSVPGNHAQSIAVYEVVAEEKKCKKVTTM